MNNGISHNGIGGDWRLVNDMKKIFHGNGGSYAPTLEMKVDEHRFAFFRLHTDDYGYMGMADFPSDKAEDSYKLAELVQNSTVWRTVTNSFDHNVANKIYYNANNKAFTYAEFIAALKSEGIEYNK